MNTYEEIIRLYVKQGVSPYAEIKRWIEEDLKHPLSDVSSLIFARNFEHTAIVNFSDGTQHKKDFNPQ